MFSALTTRHCHKKLLWTDMVISHAWTQGGCGDLYKLKPMESSSMEVGWALEGTPPAEELLAAHGFWGKETHFRSVPVPQWITLCPYGKH